MQGTNVKPQAGPSQSFPRKHSDHSGKSEDFEFDFTVEPNEVNNKPVKGWNTV